MKEANVPNNPRVRVHGIIKEPVPETIDITPTWSGILPVLLAVVANADSVEARKSAEAELRAMALAADRYNAIAEAVKRNGGILLDAIGPVKAILNGEAD